MKSFAIVPAAGRSVRMGRPKLLLPWGRGTVISRVLGTWGDSRVDRIVVVVRADDTRLQQACAAHDVDLVVPDEPPPEMKDSVELALRHIQDRYAPADTDAWFLAPADMPRFTSATVDGILAGHDPARPAILIPTFADRRGHPVLFPWPLQAQVLGLAADQGVNSLLARNPVRLIPTAEPAVLEDLDTPADFRRLRPEQP